MTAIIGLWGLAAIVVVAIMRGVYTAALARINHDISILRALPAERVTETDVLDPVEAELDEFPSLLYGDAWDASCDAWAYQMEVDECCGGRDRTCGHARP